MNRDLDDRILVNYDYETASFQANEKRKRSAKASEKYRDQYQQRQARWDTLKKWYREEVGDFSSLSTEPKMSSKKLKTEIRHLENKLRESYLGTFRENCRRLNRKVDEGVEGLPVEELRKKARASKLWVSNHWSIVI
jgi:hypothetical protein